MSETEVPVEEQEPTMSYAERVMYELFQALPPETKVEQIPLYAVLCLTKGENATLQDVHDVWAVWKCHVDPANKYLVSFDELNPEVQELDRPYLNAVKDVARKLSS